MNLIDRYVSAVGKHLPRQMRPDIEAELRSTLQDMLEDRSEETGRPVSAEMVRELLQEYGPPSKVAAAYLPPRSLIGPRLYPIFILVLRIVLTIITVLAAVGLVTALLRSEPQDFLGLLVDYGLDFISTLVLIFGQIALIFAILERILPASELVDDLESWDPSLLAEEPDPDRVSVFELVVGLIFIAGFLILINFNSQEIGLRFVQDGEWVVFPLLSETFFSYLPWITLSGLLEIALNLILLRAGFWNRLTRGLQIGVDLFAIGIAAAMLRGPSLVVSPSSLAGTAAAEFGAVVVTVIEGVIPVTLAVVMIVSLYEIFTQVRGILNQRPARQPFLQK